MFFSQDWRERIKAENPDASFGTSFSSFFHRPETWAEGNSDFTGEVGKLLGAKWKELDDEEKKVGLAPCVLLYTFPWHTRAVTCACIQGPVLSCLFFFPPSSPMLIDFLNSPISNRPRGTNRALNKKNQNMTYVPSFIVVNSTLMYPSE